MSSPLPESTCGRADWEWPFQGETEDDRLSERAHQDRDIVYFLQQPDTHAFDSISDYTETRAGVNGYANVVSRRQCRESPCPRAFWTPGKSMKAIEMSGAQMMASKINVGEKVEPTARVVVIPSAVEGRSILRLRIAETYTAPVAMARRRRVVLIEAGRPRNAWCCRQAGIAQPAPFRAQ